MMISGGWPEALERKGTDMTENERLELADEYERGLAKMEASGHEEFAEVIPKHKMIIAALRAEAEPVAWQCTDERHEFRYIKGIVTANKETAEAWKEGGLAFVGLGPIASSPPGPTPDLTDPVVVHANMLRGTIAKPTWDQIKHLYPEQTAPEPTREEIIEECAKRADNIGRIPDNTDERRAHIYCATEIAKAIRALSLIKPRSESHG
jgi:hypothetical protein